MTRSATINFLSPVVYQMKPKVIFYYRFRFSLTHIFFVGKNPLPFVNRYAETLDVCGISLKQSPSLSREQDSKKFVAVATQLSGTGKTVLGRNIIAVINRPREESELEAEVAGRLLKSRELSEKPVALKNAILARARAPQGMRPW